MSFNAVDKPGVDSRGEPISPSKAQELLDKLIALKSVNLKVGGRIFLYLLSAYYRSRRSGHKLCSSR